MADRIQYYRRGEAELKEEVVMGHGLLRWAYQEKRSGFITRLLFGSSLCSKMLGLYFDSFLSKGQIRKSIASLDIDPSEFVQEPAEFRNFNDFFTRKLKMACRPWSDDPDVLVSPADGRILVYPELDGQTLVQAKGCDFTLNDLLPYVDSAFEGGSACVIRLCPADYHRFHFPCAAEIRDEQHINGSFHSVNPIALGLGINVFCENKRVCTLLESSVFGKIWFLEVGAFGVGGIVQTYRSDRVEKMQEKGYFKFGGSTIILVFEKGRIAFAEDLLQNSKGSYETLIQVGQELGRKA